MTKKSKLLTTKQIPEIAGFSKSYYDKGHLYGYGPKFLRISGSGNSCRILYREEDVLDWLASGECNPQEARNV